MLQSIRKQRVRQDLATEQQQRNNFRMMSLSYHKESHIALVLIIF